ncbi:MAG: hypothetical protein AB4372_13800 [Xenococcus sp. (in: cyanobacteria)]
MFIGEPFTLLLLSKWGLGHLLSHFGGAGAVKAVTAKTIAGKTAMGTYFGNLTLAHQATINTILLHNNVAMSPNFFAATTNWGGTWNTFATGHFDKAKPILDKIICGMRHVDGYYGQNVFQVQHFADAAKALQSSGGYTATIAKQLVSFAIDNLTYCSG